MRGFRHLTVPLMILALPILLFFMLFGVAMIVITFLVGTKTKPDLFRQWPKGFVPRRRSSDQNESSGEVIDITAEVQRIER
jgi:hypothetical protein